MLYSIVLCCIVLCCIVLYCTLLYCSNVTYFGTSVGWQDCISFELFGLVEQNNLIETHRVGNLETTSHFSTQDLCDVILSHSVSVFRPFSRRQYNLLAVSWYTWQEPLTALICHLVTFPLDTCALKRRPCDAGYCLSEVLNWSKAAYDVAGVTTTKKKILNCGRSVVQKMQLAVAEVCTKFNMHKAV